MIELGYSREYCLVSGQNIMYGEEHGEGEGCCGGHHMHGPMHKEFKLAKLEKKEKMLKAELEFIGQMKEMIKKMPEEKK